MLGLPLKDSDLIKMAQTWWGRSSVSSACLLCARLWIPSPVWVGKGPDAKGGLSRKDSGSWLQ